jgi:hypothetical protein
MQCSRKYWRHKVELGQPSPARVENMPVPKPMNHPLEEGLPITDVIFGEH